MTTAVTPSGPTADPTVASSVTAGMEAVEARLREVVGAGHPLLRQAGLHLVQAGGKRFRPLLTLLAAQLGDPSRDEVVDAAVVVELTHLATLYHDDVMDEAAVRRGAASANARWTNTVAILTGDYLFARASDVVAGLGPDAVRIQARTFARLVEGQIAETAGPAAEQDPVEHHLQVVADKTGSLIATSARLGAMLAGASAADVETVARFGEVIGVAFQLSDDLIDVLSESEESGKTPGTDLREGIRTLPVLLALQDTSDDGAHLRALLTGDLSDDARLAEALDLLRGSSAVAAAQQRLAASVQEAVDVTRALPAGPARDALAELTTRVEQRTG